MAKLIDGKAIAAEIRREIAAETKEFTEKNGIIVLNEQSTTHPQRGMYIFFSDSKILLFAIFS